MAMQNIEKLREIIDREIEKMELAVRRPNELYLPVDYVLSNGGKRLRPVLSLLACELFSGNPASAIKPAAAIEVFHNFTLLHDDIMDKADIRRSKPTVHKKWNENTAILSGDAMMVLSYKLIAAAEREILPVLLGVFNRTALEVCEGQQMDMNFETMPL
jgi:geranylgeranyl diphosphate synthase, type II